MTAHLTSAEDFCPRSLSGDTINGLDYSILAGEDISFGNISGIRDDNLEMLLQNALRRNCVSVCKLATPHMPDLRTVVGELVDNIAADLEARLSMTARGKGHAYDTRSKLRTSDPRGKGLANGPLDAWATDILKWTEKQSYTHLAADYVTPFFEAFVLFFAHHIKTHFRNHGASGGFKPEDCRLILPIASKDMDAEHTDFDSADYVDPTDFATVECGMFSLSGSVESQAAPAHHLIVADAEIVGHPDDYNEAKLRLATKTKALYFNQHNRRFAWGLTVSNHTIHAYVFGTDGIWASTAMDISNEKGRRAFISLLVDWSLCSVDRLGFDPSIRYVVDGSVGGPYLEIDFHEMDESTGKVEPHTYYSQRCVGAADRLFGRHARYFAASTSRKSMNTPAFLIKDVWTTSGGDSAGDTHDISFLNVLHAEFDKSSEFSSSFSRLVSTGPVYINRGGTLVADSTATAFAGLPSITQGATKGSGDIKGLSSSNAQRLFSSCVCQHRRTVTKWVGNMISEADNQSQVVIAVADAMAALNAAYAKCKILHGSISDRAILLQKTVDGVKGILADFDYASYARDGAGAAEAPEPKLFQSIRCLEDPRAVRTLLDDLESLLYLVCWLGTFGVNQAQRAAYIAGLPADPNLPIKTWNRGTATDIADQKRSHMNTFASFERCILNRMRDINSPLSHLAEDIYKALFLHPGCSGTDLIPIRQVRNVGMPVAAPASGVERDPLVLRNDDANVATILFNLFDVLARHRDVALAALNAAAANIVGGA